MAFAAGRLFQDMDVNNDHMIDIFEFLDFFQGGTAAASTTAAPLPGRDNIAAALPDRLSPARSRGGGGGDVEQGP